MNTIILHHQHTISFHTIKTGGATTEPWNYKIIIGENGYYLAIDHDLPLDTDQDQFMVHITFNDLITTFFLQPLLS